MKCLSISKSNIDCFKGQHAIDLNVAAISKFQINKIRLLEFERKDIAYKISEDRLLHKKPKGILLKAKISYERSIFDDGFNFKGVKIYAFKK